MQYGKMVDGFLIYGVQPLITTAGQVFNPTHEMWLANGYKVVICAPMEDESLQPYYTEDETTIYVNWR